MQPDRVERRLAAVMAAYVAGYSRLMGIDEAGTVRALREQRAAVDPVIASHGGRIVKTTGDGMLLEFSSIVAAVECAVAIQELVTERNADVPEDRRMLFRIGINLGDVLIEDDDILGDGVNIAARLEAISPAGGICISESSYQQVRDKLAASFEDMGEQQLKNIARPVRAYRIAVGATSGKGEPALPLPDKPSVAVLPFTNLSVDPAQEYFADGMVDDIITGLSRIKWLFVIARNSTFTYKGGAGDVKRIGSELGVRYVLEGSVRKVADRMRITCQLIDAATGTHMWAERYDRKSDDIFAVQDEITLSVVGAVEPSMRWAEIERVKRKRPESLDAYDLVLQAQPDVYSRMPEHAKKALILLERALALDPSYALAHAFAAECHHTLFLRGGLGEEERTAALRHAEAAIEHGQDDALALSFAGFCIGMDGHDRVAAFALFEKALAVSPSSAITYILGSIVLAWGGEAERAIEWGERGLRLSPFAPYRSAAFLSIALGHFHFGRYEDAAAAGRKSVQSSPGFSMPYVGLAAALARIGRLEEAKATAARILQMHPGFRLSRLLADMDCSPTLAASLGEALDGTGLPK